MSKLTNPSPTGSYIKVALYFTLQIREYWEIETLTVFNRL